MPNIKILINKFVVIFFVIIYIFPIKDVVFAQTSYNGEIRTEYAFEETGSVQVNNVIRLENKFTEKYYPSFKLNLENFSFSDLYVGTEQQNYNYIQEETESGRILTIYFPDKVLGKGKYREFQIKYKIVGLAKRTGEVWEISLPQMFENSIEFKKSVSLKIPDMFGEKAYIYPVPNKVTKNENYQSYELNENYFGERIVAVFGKFQNYSVTLNYFLENDSAFSSVFPIAIPPDTSYQRVSYEKIEPYPENITVDEDGNWIASFILSPREKLNVNVVGNIQVFANPRTLLVPPTENLANNLQSQKYWEVDDENIQTIAKTVNTPEKIYDFVINNLEYKNSKDVIPIRQGGVNSLNENLTDIKCTEYTDLFIALARAAGIPARELNGFAYSDNETSKPLSLVNDLLHSWPEYWDEQKGYWVQVDPTWADTSGQNYFDNFDLKHLTFAIHGNSSEEPKSVGLYKGKNKDKDIFVNFGQSPTIIEQNIDVDIKSKLPDFKRKIYFVVQNNSKNAIYNAKFQIYFDTNLEDVKNFEIIPPYSKQIIDIEIPPSLFAVKTPSTITIFVNNKIFSFYDIKTYEVLIQVLMVLLVLTMIVIIFLRKKYLKR